MFVAREKYLLLEKNICCSKKIFVVRKKYLFFEKKYLLLEKKNTCCSVSLRPQSLIWWRRRDENGRDLQNYVSRSGPFVGILHQKEFF